MCQSSNNKIQRINPEALLDTSDYGFSQVVVTPTYGKTIYISGQMSANTQGEVLGNTVTEQMRVTFENLRHAIDAAGAKPEHVTKIQLLIVGHCQKWLTPLDKEIRKLFAQHLPASTLIPVPRLALDDMLFEMDATLFIPAKE